MRNLILSNSATGGCLGHEIHITRFILVDLLLQHIITPHDTIVTANDRKFLYTKIFTTVLNINEYINLDKRLYNIIDLSTIYTLNASTHLQFPGTTLRFNLPDFKTHILNIEYVNTNYDDSYSNDYVIIHHRYTANLDNLTKLIAKTFDVFGSTINIIIFNNNISHLEFLRTNNILLIDNLQLYASYLNGYNSKYKCKLFISEWSGGGQLSQYCFPNGNIMYYMDFYPQWQHYVDQIKKYYAGSYIENIDEMSINSENINTILCADNYFTAWDFKNLANSNIQMFLNFDNLLANYMIP